MTFLTARIVSTLWLFIVVASLPLTHARAGEGLPGANFSLRPSLPSEAGAERQKRNENDKLRATLSDEPAPKDAVQLNSSQTRAALRRKTAPLRENETELAKGASENLLEALSALYGNNPELNAERATLRVRDEDVPKAKAGFRPKINASGNAGWQGTDTHTGGAFDQLFGTRRYNDDRYQGYPRAANLIANQPLFDGFKTTNLTSQAEAGVLAARATLRVTEQTVFFKGVTAYMDVYRDLAVVRLHEKHIGVVGEQLRQTKVRYEQGDVTLTDLSQAEAALAQATADLAIAQANLKASSAIYEQVIGHRPGRLAGVKSPDAFIPKSVAEAMRIAETEHPAVIAARHQAAASEYAVKVAEAALLPTASIGMQVSQSVDSFLGLPGTRMFMGAASLQLNVPIYSGGGDYASIRQAKEQKGQTRLVADVQRINVMSTVQSSFARTKGTKAAIKSGQEVISAAEVALKSTEIEASVGQRTVLDVLNAQQALLDARVKVVGLQHDEVIAAYSLIAAMGRLSHETLALAAARYDETEHYRQVEKKWFGWETPGGN